MKTELLALIENYGKALVHQTEGKISAFKDAKNLMSNIVFLLDKAEQAQAPAAKCETCNDNGLIGGPSFYDPGEGGVPCPDCSAPAAVEPIFEGGRESVDDAIAVVESFGPGIEGLNDTFARQILLADEVKRLRRLYDSAVTGRADMRDALREARHGAQPVKLDFTKPLETDEGKPVKWIAADVIEYECARVCVDVNTGLVYSSPYVGLKIRNATEAPAAVEPVAQDLLSHKAPWRDAIQQMATRGLTSGDDEHAYWRHELMAFDTAFDALEATAKAAPADALTHTELLEIRRAAEDFESHGETDVDDELLIRGALAGYLECTHFQLLNESALELDIQYAAQAAQKNGGA